MAEKSNVQENRPDTPNAFIHYRRARIQYWQSVFPIVADRKPKNAYYHRKIEKNYAHLVSPGQRVLEIGCATGELLDSLKPSFGVGIDFSIPMIQEASSRYPHLRFIHCDAHEMCLKGPFDVIILSDIINEVWDVQTVLEQLKPISNPGTRLILNWYSKVWELPLQLAQLAGLTFKRLPQNWLSIQDINGILHLSGYETIRKWNEILWPLPTPLIGTLANRILARLWPFSLVSLANFIIAKPFPQSPVDSSQTSVSVIIPARNEAGNIPGIFLRTPEMGSRTELIFIEGGSTDNTCQAIEREIAANPHRRAYLHRQTGSGKGDAVRLGFSKATGDILMILDADMTVPPEQLPRFFQSLVSGAGEFINGVRLVYPMDKEAMRYLNLLGNKFFSYAFSWLLGQPLKDTLCGTKVLWKRDYQKISKNRGYFGEFDPFGDFDLIFGAAKLNLKIIDLPIRYAERQYGDTNISRWRHGLLLLRMVLFAIRRMKFV